MRITEQFIQNINVAENLGKKIAVGEGLYLFITPKGSKCWRFNYRRNGKGKTLAMGVYPDVKLKDARNIFHKAKVELAEGKDPCEEKQLRKNKGKEENKQKISFEMLYREWFSNESSQWCERYAKTVNAYFIKLLPKLGKRPINAISEETLREALKQFNSKETYKRANQKLKELFQYAMDKGVSSQNPAVRIKNPVPQMSIPRPAMPIYRLNDFFNELAKNSDRKTVLAFYFLILTFVRVGALCLMEWKEIDFYRKEWLIPAEKMKGRLGNKKPLKVPLSDWAIEILQELKTLSAPNNPYVFTNHKGKPKKPKFFNDKIVRLGFQGIATAHGFRAVASTILNESGLFNADAIELQLAHSGNSLRNLYNRAEYWEERKKIMQWYSDFIRKIIFPSNTENNKQIINKNDE